MRVETLEHIASAWELPRPEHIRPLAGGTNNLMHVLETPAGSFVLRVYRNATDEARVRFEHTVLASLAAANLPFALPVPIATRAGEFLVRARMEHGEALATLTALLPGAHPDRDDLAQARAGGAALGILDVALADVPVADIDEAASWRSYGDLAHCHPLVPDPRAALLGLPVAEAERTRLVWSYDALIERIPSLYASLPRQLAHEDYSPDNLLMEGARVTGVLDFEFCARDLRVMDLTVALSWWPVARFGTGDEWPILHAVADGYARSIRLSADEVRALPTLYQLRAYTSLIHRLGRYRQGLSPLAAVTDRVEAALAREEWLRTHEARLVEVVMERMSG